MIKSMTAFARVSGNEQFGTLTWELRTVNHRFLDIILRMPEDFRLLETGCREIIGKHVSRGKLECNLRFKPDELLNEGLNINEAYGRKVIDACNKINKLSNQSAEINPVEILKWPGVVQESEKDLKPAHLLCNQLFEQALQELVSHREREGKRLSEFLISRCKEVKKILTELKKHLPNAKDSYRSKILTKLEELKTDIDKDRLEQELVYLAQKMDVDEELDRLESHLEEMNETLKMDESVGRRLDFIMQEFNREANTLGSKSASIETTQASIELKVLIEQMREQIQNIE